MASVNQVVVNKANGRIFIACGSHAQDGSTGGAWVSRDRGKTWQLIFDMPHVRGVAPSPVSDNVIAVNVGSALSIGSLNPGAYVTVDGGATWHKINHDLGQPDRINELAADPYDANILWCALYGTGFGRADLSGLRAVWYRGGEKRK